MIGAAISTFGGVETSNSYQAGLAFEREDAAALARRTRCIGGSKATVRRDGSRGAILEIVGARRAGTPFAGLAASASGASRRRPRSTRRSTLERGRRRPVSRRRASARRPMGSDHRIYARRRTRCSARAAVLYVLRLKPMAETLDLSLFVPSAPDGTPHGSRGRRHRLRRLHPQDRKRGETASRRDRSPAQFHRSPAACRLAPTRRLNLRDDRGLSRQSAIRRIHSQPARAETGRGRRGASAHTMSGGRGLCRHEHHAAVGLGVVGQAPTSRRRRAISFIGFGADRAAGRRLRGASVLPQRLARACESRALNMDVPISLGVILALGMSLIETHNHADHAYFDSARHAAVLSLCGR